MWLDSHCHITAEEFEADRGETIQRAQDAGVDALIAIGSGYGIEHNRLATDLAASDPRVYATVGVHPHDAALLDDDGRRALRDGLGLPRVVAVGECGLDYFYENSPVAVQREVFAEQVAWAREFDLPVSIHVRDKGPAAYEELLEIWASEGGGQVSGVLHCFTGTLDFAQRALEHRLDISFSGILTFKRDRGLRDVAKNVPLERTLVETDAPLLAPEGFRGKRNEPARVALVGEALAAIHDQPVEEVARVTHANARRVFRLDDPA